MTDRDNSSGSFLERWSRKKIEGEPDRPDAPADASAQPESPPDESALSERAAETDVKAPGNAAKPEFDLASLPSLDSITAMTDIRAFLAPGVPKELARAALRRAWSADPAIRDFKGLAENDWDFTDPAAMPGFGALPEGYDVQKLVAQIFGDGEKPAEPEAAPDQAAALQTPAIADENPPLASQGEAAPVPADEAEAGPAKISGGDKQVAQQDIVRCDNNIAPHNSIPGDEPEEPKNRRQHGGALPQ
jgi:hypothetical protein